MPAVPPTHLDLLDRPLVAVLTTHQADGRLQSTVVWFGRDGEDLLVSTMAEFQKARNLSRRPRATVLIVAPEEEQRWIELRGEVTRDDGDAVALLDELTLRYTGTTPYFGACVPAELAAVEHPVAFRLTPTTIVTGPGRPRPRAGDPPPLDRLPTLPPELPTPPPLPCGSPAPRPPSDPGVDLPADHLDLFDRPLLAALSTRLPDGSAQTQPVWCCREGNHVLVSTTLERRKGRNLVADPRATVLVVDPEDTGRWTEVRGDVALVTQGAVDLLDRLTRAYTGRSRYYGDIAPEGFRDTETRVTVRLRPRRVVCDAVHR